VHAGRVAGRGGTRRRPPTRWGPPRCSWARGGHVRRATAYAVRHPAREVGLTVSAGSRAQVLHRAARQATPTYTTLCKQVCGSPWSMRMNRLAGERRAPLVLVS
jgi:hypothetical protein